MNKETIKLNITGMTCDHCATGIEKLLSKNEGVKEAIQKGKEIDTKSDNAINKIKEITDKIKELTQKNN